LHPPADSENGEQPVFRHRGGGNPSRRISAFVGLADWHGLCHYRQPDDSRAMTWQVRGQLGEVARPGSNRAFLFQAGRQRF